MLQLGFVAVVNLFCSPLLLFSASRPGSALGRSSIPITWNLTTPWKAQVKLADEPNQPPSLGLCLSFCHLFCKFLRPKCWIRIKKMCIYLVVPLSLFILFSVFFPSFRVCFLLFHIKWTSKLDDRKAACCKWV